MVKDKTKEVIKILEDNKLTNISTPEDQIRMNIKGKKVEEHHKMMKELQDSMVSSRHQEYVRKEMDKIRAEGLQENNVSDTHKIINEAERRVKERGNNS